MLDVESYWRGVLIKRAARPKRAPCCYDNGFVYGRIVNRFRAGGELIGYTVVYAKMAKRPEQYLTSRSDT